MRSPSLSQCLCPVRRHRGPAVLVLATARRSAGGQLDKLRFVYRQACLRVVAQGATDWPPRDFPASSPNDLDLLETVRQPEGAWERAVFCQIERQLLACRRVKINANAS